MQKFVSIYALAAHLAILAVAPLFLFPFVSANWVAAAVLWLSLLTAFWVLLEPARLHGELPNDARRRVMEGIVSDPLFYILVGVVVLTAIRALNGGIGLKYDAEIGKWSIGGPSLGLLPGCVSGHGTLEFAASVALLVLAMGCTHSLARRARTLVLAFCAFFAGLSGLVSAVAWYCGHGETLRLATISSTMASYHGVAFALYLIGGVFALGSVFEQGLSWFAFMLMLGIGGCALGAFLFSPGLILLIESAGLVVAFIVVAVRVFRTMPAVGTAKFTVTLLIGLALATLSVMSFMPDGELIRRVIGFTGASSVDEGYWELRSALGTIASKVWQKSFWLGGGLGSTSLEMRFAVPPELWHRMPYNQASFLNGWWQLLAERGIFGLLIVGVPFIFMAWEWVRRLIVAITQVFRQHKATYTEAVSPLVFLPLVALGMLAACAMYESSFIRPEVMLATGIFMVVGASSFRKFHHKSEHQRMQRGQGVSHG